ncbi:GD14269 [Drosophila simulans]|uniref:GD14269 n=1 Tax=Drosophila simulans TaxID=7240 RepID=B4QPL8_DROSI|nr:GD14269 [Drosophila simulans]
MLLLQQQQHHHHQPQLTAKKMDCGEPGACGPVTSTRSRTYHMIIFMHHSNLTLDNISDSESGALKLRGKCDLDADPSLNPDPDSDTDGDTNAESDSESDPVGDACLCLVCLWFVTRIDIDGLTEDFPPASSDHYRITLSSAWAGSPLGCQMSGLDGLI